MRWRAVAVATALAACASTSPSRDASRAPATRSPAVVAIAPPSVSALPSEEDAGTDAGEGDAAIDGGNRHAGRRAAFDATPPVLVDVGAWLAGHGVKRGAFAEKRCWESAVGVPPTPGLSCRARGRRVRIFWLDQGKMKKVWEAVVDSHSDWIDIRPVISADGTEVEVKELHDNCDGAIMEAESKWENGINDRDYVDSIREACRSLGRYVWSGDRYARPTLDAGP